ncbi:MFS transporter [Rhizorhabdus wittichii]|uniref:MFS transporter n=1 Tax=Rhizorhabdus wittichii TaxID=160791 RepID=A0A975D2D4_9SPHN|nr:MFS transporter [Rhizorhabdus wittichii]QTH21682.1 MFS transporter [Rhizorhabdus wittichii]
MTASTALSPAQNVALIVVSPLAWLTITLLPYEVTALAVDYRMGPSAAGWIAACELLALALTVVSISPRIVALDKRRLTLAGIALALLASAGSIVVADTSWLIPLRLFFGIGSGLIAAATNALSVFARHPERTIAWMQIMIAINFGVSIYGAGTLAAPVGREATFLVELLLLATVGGAGFLLSPGVAASAGAAGGGPSRLPRGLLRALGALALMYLSQAAVWAYAEQAGTGVGFGAVDLALLLTIAAFTTPLGGFAAAAMRDRFGHALPLAIGFGVQMFVAFTVYCLRSVEAYAAGIMVFNMTTPFTTSYLMSLLAGLDESGRGTSLGGSAINFGAAAGPALAALLVVMPSRAPIGLLSIAVLAIGLALALSARRELPVPARA